MANIYQSIKSSFTPEVISRISSLLGESDSQVKSAVNMAIPALLSGFLEKGNSGSVKTILQDAYKNNVLDEKEGIFTQSEGEKLRIGERFLDEVAGDCEPPLTSLISSDEIMSSGNSRKLLGMISAAVAGALAKRLNATGNSMERLLGELQGESDVIYGALPPALRGNLKKEEPQVKAAPVKKNGMNWIWPLLGFLILALLLWWGMRSCNSCNRANNMGLQSRADTTVLESAASPAYELTLPDGNVLTVYRGGMEDRMIEFLNSDAYKNGTDADMQKHWFEFDKLDFEFGSATELTDGSEKQLANLVAILKHFSNTRIRIGGNADKVGSEGVNMAVSEQRANTIKKMMVEAGIAANRISTEGFGEETAVIPATATDAERAPDRDIAIRFMK